MPSFKRAVALTTLLFVASFICVAARAQQAGGYRGFTLVGQVTDYDAQGNSIPTYSETRYFSANGGWRYVAVYQGGHTIETIYRDRDGVYFPDHRSGRLLKVAGGVAGRLFAVTAEGLRAELSFSRTETVLGLTAYVLRERDQHYGYVTETYFVPELGRLPFKRVTTYRNGWRRVEEPLSITFKEPSAAEVRGADYKLIERTKLSDRKLDGRFQSKPEPYYPGMARVLGLHGTVTLQVSVDEGGKVTSARVVSLPLPLLDEAAIEAVYQARITPDKERGKPVRTAGVVSYEFTLFAAKPECK